MHLSQIIRNTNCSYILHVMYHSMAQMISVEGILYQCVQWFCHLPSNDKTEATLRHLLPNVTLILTWNYVDDRRSVGERSACYSTCTFWPHLLISTSEPMSMCVCVYIYISIYIYIYIYIYEMDIFILVGYCVQSLAVSCTTFWDVVLAAPSRVRGPENTAVKMSSEVWLNPTLSHV